MANFAVKSPLTNFLLNEATNLCVQKLFEGRNHMATMAESFTLSDNEYYRQYVRVTIDSTLGPSFPKIFLCAHEILWLLKCPIA